MIGLGLLAGAVFPPFVVGLGVSADEAFTVQFFGATLLAGLVVGAANWWLARIVIGRRLQALSGGMQYVADAIQRATETGDWSACERSDCLLPADSEDELGDAASAFNRLVEALERSHEVESAIRDLFQTLSSRLDLEQLVDTSVRWIVEHVGAASGALHLGDEAVAGLPVVFGGERLGTLVLAQVGPLSADDERVVALFMQAFAVALRNALTHARSQELALLDPLTGCANRRAGLRRLDDELAAGEVGVLMIDLDHFKRINDTRGHLAGDRVLAHAATLIRDCLRDTDTLVRYGGEEFLAIVPGAHDDGLAERIRARLEATPVDGLTVTASFGAARGRGGTPEQLLEHADRALYRAKAAGRNQVCVAS